MKKTIFLLLLIPTISLAVGFSGKIGLEDLALGTGTFTRRTSTGGTVTLTEINGTNIALAGTGGINWSYILSTPTTLAGYGIVDALSAITDNSITPAKLSSTFGTADNTTFYRGDGGWIAVDLSSKQDTHANLDTMTSPGVSKIFYSDDSGVIQTVTLGTAGTVFTSAGPGSAPTFSAGGAGVPGGSDTQVQVNDNGVFRGSSAMVFGLDNMLVLTNPITAPGFVSTASDNTRFFGRTNTGDLTDATLDSGRFWFNGTENITKVRNGDNTATLEVFTSGASHTLSFSTSGTLTGGIMILDNVASPTAAQMFGSLNTITTAGSVTFPDDTVAGMSTCVAINADIHVDIHPGTGHNFILDGVSMAEDEHITNSTASAAGDFICFIAVSTTVYKAMGKQGTWTEETP